jgi:hypothetical protein
LKKLLRVTVFLSSAAISQNSFSENNYEKNLIGIWAMNPILEPVKGAANVTQYNQDGSYHLFDYICTGDGHFTRDPSHDSRGRWRIEGNNIITTPGEPEELKKLAVMADELRTKLDSESPEKRKMLRSAAPKDILNIIDGNYPEGTETIITLSSTTMKSKQEWILGSYMHFTSIRVNEVKPSCDKFNVQM